jgi:3-deoxy-D-manno-octulosonate 8-phosphate phosphatase (KDO 8-P phosphatase)
MIDPVVAQRIALVAFDVDGTLTDNGLFIGVGQGGERVELKRYDVQDGMGIVMLRRAGIKIAFVSARDSASTTLRAAELGVVHVAQGKGLEKIAALSAIGAELGIAFESMAFVGDDLADLGVMQRVALSAAPANAVAEVLAVADLRLTRVGGYGAAREFTEVLLRARNQWDGLVAAYAAESTPTVSADR